MSRRVIAFVKGTVDDKRIIGANNLIQISLWIDAAYTVNPDMKSQTGGDISMGIGILYGKCGNQRLNVKRSMEAEMVDVSDNIVYYI